MFLLLKVGNSCKILWHNFSFFYLFMVPGKLRRWLPPSLVYFLLTALFLAVRKSRITVLKPWLWKLNDVLQEMIKQRESLMSTWVIVMHIPNAICRTLICLWEGSCCVVLQLIAYLSFCFKFNELGSCYYFKTRNILERTDKYVQAYFMVI